MIPATFLLCAIVPAQLAPSLDPRPMPISGVVVDTAGKPVAGAEVWLADGIAPRDHRVFGDEIRLEPYTDPGEGLEPVLVHATTDQSGKFCVEAPVSYTARRWRSPLVLFAKSGAARAIRRLPIVIGPDQSPVMITLKAAPPTELTVVDPQDNPVVGASVLPLMVNDVPVPNVVARALGGTSDARGRVAMGPFPIAAIQEVRVEGSGFGTQRLRVDEQADSSGVKDRSEMIALAPVGRVIGRLVPPGNEPIRGVTVRATTQEGGYEGSGRSGMAEVPVQESGRFEIGAIVAGSLQIELVFDPRTDTTLRPETLGRIIVAAGKTTELSIPLRSTVTVKGSFREKGTNKPIAAVMVVLNGMFGGDYFAVTGADGKYQGYIAREIWQPYGWTMRIPNPFFDPSAGPDTTQRMPPAGINGLVLPPIDLPRGLDVPGSVVDEAGRAAAGALIEATWTHATGRVQLVTAGSDSTGRFVLHGVDPMAELTYNARLADSVSPGGIVARAEASLTKPIVLPISPRHGVPVGGRVLNSSGQPFVGASVRIWRVFRGKNDRVRDLEPIMSDDGRVVVRTDAEGRYRAPRRVLPGDEFFAEASAPGRLSTRSRSARIDERGGELPPVILRRLRPISGQVVDRQGRPVAGAVVRQSGDGPMPTETRTDEQGRFQLPGVLEGPVILLVEKSGFRSAPHAVSQTNQPITVSLGRADEPPVVSYKTLPSALPADEEKALARRLFEPFAEHVLKNGKEEDKRKLLTSLAEIDAVWTLEHLDTVKFTDPDELNGVRSNIAGALVRDNPDEAAAVAEGISDPYTRAWAYVGMTRDLLKRAPVHARMFLEQAILNNKTSGPRKQAFLGREVIGLLIDLGENERAREMVRVQRELIKSAFDARNRTYALNSYVLLPLVRLDPAAALAEIEDSKQKADQAKDRSLIGTFDGLFGRIAYILADRLPAESETLIRRMLFSHIRPANTYVLAVCSRMATKDLPRARRLADLITPGEIEKKPFALGLMALALAATDKPAALGLLDESFSELEGLRDRGRVSQFASISSAAAALLPIVEQVDPDRLPEYLARAVALRPPQNEGKNRSLIPELAGPLAMMVARYDRALAAQIIAPDLENLGKLSVSYAGADLKTNPVLCAEALIDPRKAVDLIEALPERPSMAINGFAPTKNEILMEAARLLSLHGAERWRHVYERYLLLWTPDQKLR